MQTHWGLGGRVACLARLALGAALVPVAFAAWSDGDVGIDRPYGDLPNMPYAVNTTADCYNACQALDICVAWAVIPGSCGIGNVTLCYLKEEVMPQAATNCRVSGVKNHTLLPFAFAPLPIPFLQPQGWWLRQLQVQAEGLSGHLPFFWPDVQSSVWIGGAADPGLHERTPYWLNGFVPLAGLLNDPALLGTAAGYVDYILTHQAADGWMGPDDDSSGNQYWARFPLLLALMQYSQVNASDARVGPAMVRLVQAMHLRMLATPMGDSWSGARWMDLVVAVHWLLEHGPANVIVGQEQMLWDAAELASQQGFDWSTWFDSELPTGPVPPAECTLYTHGVNNAQALKSSAVWYRQSHSPLDAESSVLRVQNLYQYHGLPSGVIAADEHLAGRMPSRGSELCAVAEALYSFSYMFAVHGLMSFADQAERIAFNAMPATVTKDMWAHQYLQQANEVNAMTIDNPVWATDGPNATLFGLEPNYGCCTADGLNQGFPKFATHAVFATPGNGGLAVVQFVPTTVTVPLGFLSPQWNPAASPITLNISTWYPFGDVVNITVTNAPAGFPLGIRIPGWQNAATVAVNGGAPYPAPVTGQVYTLSLAAGTSFVQLNLNPAIVVERQYNNSASIIRGPVLYALPMGEQFRVLANYSFQSRDYEILPTTPWNFALVVANDSNPEGNFAFGTLDLPPGELPFDTAEYRVFLRAQARPFPQWTLESSAAAPPPASPVCGASASAASTTADREAGSGRLRGAALSEALVNARSGEILRGDACGPAQDIVLVPFGCTDLRISEFPTALA